MLTRWPSPFLAVAVATLGLAIVTVPPANAEVDCDGGVGSPGAVQWGCLSQGSGGRVSGWDGSSAAGRGTVSGESAEVVVCGRGSRAEEFVCLEEWGILTPAEVTAEGPNAPPDPMVLARRALAVLE